EYGEQRIPLRRRVLPAPAALGTHLGAAFSRHAAAAAHAGRALAAFQLAAAAVVERAARRAEGSARERRARIRGRAPAAARRHTQGQANDRRCAQAVSLVLTIEPVVAALLDQVRPADTELLGELRFVPVGADEPLVDEVALQRLDRFLEAAARRARGGRHARRRPRVPRPLGLADAR